ncbi:MAG: flagellar hook protein FlgE, partial [Candidatus Competibacteraceae bacterium]|nr:flagellar hook protein FlgE [Candidatus Competibacteraceae bacterium]
FVVNSGGQKLQGYAVTQITNSDGSVEDRLTGTIGNIKIENGDAPPRSTSRIDFGANLSADAEAPTVTPFDAASPDTYNHSTSLPVYDSQGNQHTMSLYFVKDGNAANTWAVHFTLTDKAGTTTPGSAAATLSYTDNGTFDMTAGTPTADIEFDLSGFSTATKPQGAASPLQIKMDFSSTTQFGGASSTNALSQNGYSSGRLVGVEVDDKGQVQGRYSNGENKLLGQVSLFDFRNVQGLEPVGDSNWVQTSASGEAVPGAAQTASLGSVVSAALESSNVEMTKELVKMISAQRSFQANAQVISASDQMQQTILQTMR